MADRIRVEDGKASMMYVRQEPWHGLGTKLEKPATAAEAIHAANLDWDVMKVPLYAWGDGIAYPIDGSFTVVPKDRWGKEKCPTFGIVGGNYTPLQNRESFEFFDPIVDAGEAIYHTAGALDDGRRIWLLAKLPDDIQVADKDITHKYLLLSNSHDGSGSVQIKFTPVRVVCHNTLTMALKEGESPIRVPHTRALPDRLEAARQSLQLIKTGYANIDRDFKSLVKTKIDDARLAEYVKLVFPEPKTKERRERDRVEKDRTRASTLFSKGEGNSLPGVVGSLWAAYNGIAEMVDHSMSKRTPDQHLDYIWFGSGYGLKARAFSMAKHQMDTVWKDPASK